MVRVVDCECLSVVPGYESILCVMSRVSEILHKMSLSTLNSIIK